MYPKVRKISPTKRENVSKRNPETNCFFRFCYLTLKGTWIITTKKKRFVVVLCLNDFRNILFGGLEHEFNQGHIVTLAKLSPTNASSLLCIAYMHSPLAAALLYTSPDRIMFFLSVSVRIDFIYSQRLRVKRVIKIQHSRRRRKKSTRLKNTMRNKDVKQEKNLNKNIIRWLFALLQVARKNSELRKKLVVINFTLRWAHLFFVVFLFVISFSQATILHSKYSHLLKNDCYYYWCYLFECVSVFGANHLDGRNWHFI